MVYHLLRSSHSHWHNPLPLSKSRSFPLRLRQYRIRQSSPRKQQSRKKYVPNATPLALTLPPSQPQVWIQVPKVPNARPSVSVASSSRASDARGAARCAARGDEGDEIEFSPPRHQRFRAREVRRPSHRTPIQDLPSPESTPEVVPWHPIPRRTTDAAQRSPPLPPSPPPGPPSPELAIAPLQSLEPTSDAAHITTIPASEV